MPIISLIAKVFKVMRAMAQVGLSLAFLSLAGLYAYQKSLIYPASLNDGHGYCATPDKHGMPEYEQVDLVTDDGETLQCYSLKHDTSSPIYTNKTILILSPNSGNIGHALPIVSMFYLDFNYNVFIYSYRGYGKSTGSPSETGLKIDAQRVVKYLTDEDEQYSQSSIILYGRSLGGAVASYIAATMPSSVHAIIIENTFLSIRKTIPHIFPWLKIFTGFVHQKWESETLFPLIPSSVPVLFLSARRDEIVPPGHMDELFELSKSEQKVMYKFEESMHNDTIVQPDYWEIVHDFVKNKVNPVGY